MLSLRLFGGVSLSDSGNPVPARANQRRRLALLSILAVSAGKPVSRDKLALLLWPGADAEQARHLLSDSIYVLRSALGDEVIVTAGENVAINTDLVGIDIVEFMRAIEAGDYRKAVDLRNGVGPFLDGVHLIDSPEFERWVEGVRVELAASYHTALKRLANSSSGAGDFQAAVTWWRRLAAEDPLSAAVALELMRALDAAGDRSAALAYARVYESVVRGEIDSPPDPSITAFAEQLRRGDADRRIAIWTATPPSQIARDSPARESTPARAVDAEVGTHPRARWMDGMPYAAALLLIVVIAGIYVGWRSRSHEQGAQSVELARSAPEVYRVRHSTTNPAAHDLYLRGRHDREARTDSGFRAAVADYRAAIDLDSTFADAYAGLSEAYSLLRVSGVFEKYPPRETAFKAESAAVRAVSLADTLAEGHLALGIVRMNGKIDFAASERELLRARALDPTDPRTPEYLVKLYAWTGRPDQALREARAAVNADPLSLGALRELGRALYAARRYEEALIQLDRMRTVGMVRAAGVMAGETYALEGRYPAALRELVESSNEYVLALRGYTLARMGNRAAADSVLKDLTDRWRRGRGGAFEVAIVWAGLRDFDHAFEWLDKSFEDVSTSPEIMDPLFDDVRADPRFAAVARRLGLTTSQANIPRAVAGL